VSEQKRGDECDVQRRHRDPLQRPRLRISRRGRCRRNADAQRSPVVEQVSVDLGASQYIATDRTQSLHASRYAWFDGFFADFYNTDVLAPERIGEAALRASFQVAAGASPYASYACVDTWLTDFRGDLPKIDIPTLVVHGTADRILPFQATAARLRDEKLIADLTVVEVDDGPHNIGWTHPDETNAALLESLGR
jgi:non-heme chloroperoxidase